MIEHTCNPSTWEVKEDFDLRALRVIKQDLIFKNKTTHKEVVHLRGYRGRDEGHCWLPAHCCPGKPVIMRWCGQSAPLTNFYITHLYDLGSVQNLLSWKNISINDTSKRAMPLILEDTRFCFIVYELVFVKHTRTHFHILWMPDIQIGHGEKERAFIYEGVMFLSFLQTVPRFEVMREILKTQVEKTFR